MTNTATRVKLVLALGSLSGAAWAGTSASFGDTQDAVSAFTAGSVDLTLNGSNSSPYSFTSLALSNVKPGDEVYAPLTVANAGTLAYTYTMSTAATNGDGKALRDKLQLGAKVVANAGACDSSGYSGSSTTVVAEGNLSAAAISSRGLAASASEVLCVHVSLPSNAGDAYQGATTTATFTFTAAQT